MAVSPLTSTNITAILNANGVAFTFDNMVDFKFGYTKLVVARGMVWGLCILEHPIMWDWEKPKRNRKRRKKVVTLFCVFQEQKRLAARFTLLDWMPKKETLCQQSSFV